MLMLCSSNKLFDGIIFSCLDIYNTITKNITSILESKRKSSPNNFIKNFIKGRLIINRTNNGLLIKMSLFIIKNKKNKKPANIYKQYDD